MGSGASAPRPFTRRVVGRMGVGLRPGRRGQAPGDFVVEVSGRGGFVVDVKGARAGSLLLKQAGGGAGRPGQRGLAGVGG